MQLVKGGKRCETANSDRIIVIDDPISSLDSTILFVKVFDKGRNQDDKKRKKVHPSSYTLTHNAYFHVGSTSIDKDRQEIKMKDGFGFHHNRTTIQCLSRKPNQGPHASFVEWAMNKDKISIITLQNTMRRVLWNLFYVLWNMMMITFCKISSLQEKKYVAPLVML